MSRSVLIVDDEHLFAKAVAKKLGRAGYRCALAASLAEATAALARERPDLLLLDMRLPDGSGLDFLRHHAHSLPPVVVVTAYGEVEDAVTAMKYGALDYLTKPVDLDRLQAVLDNALQRAERRDRSGEAGRGTATAEPELLGDSAALQALRERLARIARLADRAGRTPPTVLLSGETGTGKDLAARWLHARSPRCERPFVHVDCAALPRELVESELFGHERGAFTGAQGEHSGLIEVAGEGTVFLDEIGELPAALQAKLLAVLERRSLRRVGGSRERPVPAWFIAASNRDLALEVQDGAFRADLYYRLRVL
ncbi:MAG: sigma-54 dependent transcriptional regulator, partial [Candidatus Competibacterales bacterium]|nr:sigma-54 dependent transcriptional regulator [Candidatus Competibacterales bacterium]